MGEAIFLQPVIRLDEAVPMLRIRQDVSHGPKAAEHYWFRRRAKGERETWGLFDSPHLMSVARAIRFSSSRTTAEANGSYRC